MQLQAIREARAAKVTEARALVSGDIRMRYRPGITSQDRLSHEGRIYNIESVVDVRSARRELVLMVRG